MAVLRTDDEVKKLLAQGHNQYDINNLTNEELNQIAQARNTAKLAANGGTTDWTAANKLAESIRSGYGYSLGSNGNTYSALASAAKTTSEAPTYVSQYADAISSLKDAILNREAFSYDYKTDPSYQSYKKQYTREGKRSTADTLGQAAALTGGMPSTAAVTAATQAGDYYAAQLSDKIPELRDAAYSMYQNEGNTMLNNLSTLLSLENADYAKYQDQLNQYNTDRNYNYQVAQDELAQNNWQNQFDYQKQQDALSQQNWQTQFDYQKQQDALDRQQAAAKLEAASESYPTTYLEYINMTGNAGVLTEDEFNAAKRQKRGNYNNYASYKDYLKSMYISNVRNATIQNQLSSNTNTTPNITSDTYKEINTYRTAGYSDEQIMRALSSQGKYTGEELAQIEKFLGM